MCWNANQKYFINGFRKSTSNSYKKLYLHGVQLEYIFIHPYLYSHEKKCISQTHFSSTTKKDHFKFRIWSNLNEIIKSMKCDYNSNLYGKTRSMSTYRCDTVWKFKNFSLLWFYVKSILVWSKHQTVSLTMLIERPLMKICHWIWRKIKSN